MKTNLSVAATILLLIGMVSSGCGQRADSPAPKPALSEVRPPSISAESTPSSSPAETEQTRRQPKSASELIESIDDGVVLVRVFNNDGKEEGLGSGFVIDADGLIATSFHVVSTAAKAVVQFRDGTKFDVLGYRAWDPDGDLAILQLSGTPPELEVLALQPGGDPKLAEEVIAIGHPQGFKFSITKGIVSAVYRGDELPKEYQEVLEYSADRVWIETDAAISGGSSGGPLLNMQGEVIGINTWVAGKHGFAADARHIRALRERVLEKPADLWTVAEPEVEWERLVTEYTSAHGGKFRILSQSGTGFKAKISRGGNPAPIFGPKFLAFARKYRGTAASFRALSLVCDMTAKDKLPDSRELLKEAVQQLAEDHLNNERLGRVIYELSSSPHEAALGLARQALQESTNRESQGIACYCLALALRRDKQPSPEKAAEIASLFERVEREFSDVVLFDKGPLGELAKYHLFELNQLAVGKQAPEIIGMDGDGMELKLSDLRGKVVLLSFWALDATGEYDPYDDMQFMVELFRAKPFVLMGVTSDEPNEVRLTMEDEVTTWRSWHDGAQGLIKKQWHVKTIPAFFVMDHNGVIRYKRSGKTDAAQLRKTIHDLMAAVQGAAKPPSERSDAESDPAALFLRIEDITQQATSVHDVSEWATLQRQILETSRTLMGMNPGPESIVRARAAWVRAVEAVTRVEGKKAEDLMGQIDKYHDAIAADENASESLADAHFYKIRVHLNVEREGSENDPSINRRLLDWAKEFANKHGVAFALELLRGIAENAEMDGQAETASEAYEMIRDQRFDSRLAEPAKDALRRVSFLGKAFDFSQPTLDGGVVHIQQLKGKVVLLHFWALLSEPSLAELADVQKLYEKYHALGLEVVGVCQNTQKSDLRKFVSERNLPWPHIVFAEDRTSQAMFRHFGITAAPSNFLVGRDGVLRRTGLHGPQLEPAVVELLGLKKDPTP